MAGSVRPLVVREAQPGDGQGLAEVWSEAARYYAELFPDDFQVPAGLGLAAWFEAGLCSAPRAADRRATVAAEGDEILGLAVGKLVPPMASAGQQWNPSLGLVRLHVDALAVHPRHWRRGVGQRLVMDLERWARDNGAGEAVTDTYCDSPVSLPFWQQKMGYTPRSVILRKRL
jgi:GNAT superfamily N-acetyltransferase